MQKIGGISLKNVYIFRIMQKIMGVDEKITKKGWK